MKRKIIIILTMLTISIIFTPVLSSADTEYIKQSYSSTSFTKDWMVTKPGTTIDGGTYYLTYGYDTFLINEDYAYAYSNVGLHASRVYHNGHYHYGPWLWGNEGRSDLEVMHHNSPVFYYHMWK